MIELGLKLVFAYLIGSVLGSLVVGALHGGVDIRTTGSGNAGGTNALRSRGKAFAFWVMVIDVGKGVLVAACLPALMIPGVGIDTAIPRELVLYGVGVAAIVGHVFPVWFEFRGGKGGATAIGLLAFYVPLLALPVIAVWACIVVGTGFVGLATMGAAVAAAVMIGWLHLPAEPGLFAFACVVAALIVFTHRSNIRRMWAREEPRVGRFRRS